MATGRPELTKVTINSIDVSSYLKEWTSNTNKDNSTIKGANIYFSKAIEQVLTVDKELNGKTVTIQRGISSSTETYILRGEVINVAAEGGMVIITCADKMYTTTKKTVTKSFDKNIDSEAGKYSEIFKTLINDYTDLTADATSVQDSGTANVLTKFICRAVSVFDRLKALADTIGWQFYYNSDTDKVYFEPQGYSTQTTLAVSGTNITEIPKWDYDSSKLYNVVELRGAQQEVETTETGQIGVTTGYTTTSITLNNTPVSTKVYSDSSNPPTTLRKGGISSSSSTFDYTVDKDSKKIEWNSTYTPGGSDYVKVDYSYYVPVPVVINDSTSEATYGTKKTIVHKYDILNVSDAENYATEYLNSHKDPVIRTTLKLQDVSDLEVGQKITIQDNFNDINDEFIIVRVKMSYPYRNDEIEVVSHIIDEDMFQWEISQRVKRLEEENTSDTDLLLHVLSSSRDIQYERRYTKLELTNIAGETGIYGHSIYGIYGTSKYGDSTSGGFVLGHSTFGVLGTSTLGSGATSPVTTRIVQGKNIYKEFVYDDDFYDSTNSINTTWNTSTKEITITAEGVCYTSAIALGAAYSYFTVILANATNDYTIEISGDGKSNWQTVTENTRTSFISSDTTGVYIRITNTETGGGWPTVFGTWGEAASDVVVANTYKTTGAYDLPAIRCRLEE